MLHPALPRDASQAARSCSGVIEPPVHLSVTLRLDLVMLFRIARPTVNKTISHYNRQYLPTTGNAGHTYW
jgi:hypothetical protein